MNGGNKKDSVEKLAKESAAPFLASYLARF
jgi:hypothetical protein